MLNIYLKNIFKGRYILKNLVIQDLKARYRNSILGMAWTFLTPLGLVLIIGSVYSIIFGQRMEEFVPYLFSGLIPWIFIQSCADGGTACFIGAQGYIKQTQTPLEIFPIRTALGAFVNLIISLGVFWIVYLFLAPKNFSVNMLLVFPALIIWILFGITWATLAGFAHVYVRDFGPIQSLVLQGLFYASPVIYPVEMIMDKGFDWLLYINPIYYFYDILRYPLLGESPTNNYSYLVCTTIVLIMFMLSVYLTEKIGRRIAYRI